MAIVYATEENYEELISQGFVIVDFFSTTCVPCKAFSAVLEELESEIPFLNIVKVNTTDYPALGKKNKIFAVPTIFFMKNGEKVKTNCGVMSADEVKAVVAEYLY